MMLKKLPNFDKVWKDLARFSDVRLIKIATVDW